MLAGQPYVCLNALICSSTLPVMGANNRVVCKLGAYEHLFCVNKTLIKI